MYTYNLIFIALSLHYNYANRPLPFSSGDRTGVESGELFVAKEINLFYARNVL